MEGPAEIHVTIEKIVRGWGHYQLGLQPKAKGRRELCRKLLPDAPEVVAYFRAPEDGGLDDGTLVKLVRGNRKSRKSCRNTFGCIGFTETLVQGLNEDRAFIDPKGCMTTYRANLLDKILALVKTSSELGPQSPLFAMNPLEADEPDAPAAAAYEKLRRVQDGLLKRGTLRATAYCVYLLVIAAWVQWDIAKLHVLYREETIGEYLDEPESVPTEKRRPLADPNYFGSYHIYAHRATQRTLFEQGTLTMSPQQGEPPLAELKLGYWTTKPAGREWVERTYSGSLYMTAADHSVYAMLKDEEQNAAFLSFPYEVFRGAMYYRTGLLLSYTPRSGTPQVQKLAIAQKEAAREDLPQIMGILSTAGSRIMLTREQLDGFCRAMEGEPWMAEFRRSILPFIEAHQCQCYCFGEEELLSYSGSDMEEVDRLRVALTLKGMPMPKFEEENRFLRCNDPKNLHKLMSTPPSEELRDG